MQASVIRQERLWVYAVLPVILINVGALLIYGPYYALKSQQPQLVAHFPAGQLTFILYIFVVVVVLSFALFINRKLQRSNTSLMTLIAPEGLRTFKWVPAVGIFLLMNLISVAYVLFARLLGIGPTVDGLAVWQKVAIIAAVVLVEPFCEELIWRGYLITRLVQRGRKSWTAITLAALSFALLHGIFFPDKLVVEFLTGAANGWYYVRQRNLIPLIVAHAVVNLWSFSVFFFIVR